MRFSGLQPGRRNKKRRDVPQPEGGYAPGFQVLLIDTRPAGHALSRATSFVTKDAGNLPHQPRSVTSTSTLGVLRFPRALIRCLQPSALAEDLPQSLAHSFPRVSKRRRTCKKGIDKNVGFWGTTQGLAGLPVALNGSIFGVRDQHTFPFGGMLSFFSSAQASRD